ncbi:hypothetical protein EJ110_NYTH34167 [Nymphaea thermarum]|nr:hypothetical protein EJ110_NYTH34167 [Nymphaea thermarum]
MGFLCSFVKSVALLWILFVSTRAEAQYSAVDARSVDAFLQDHAYKALVHPLTGIAYNASVPSAINGVKLSVVRLRSGSLKSRGAQLFEFHLPPGVRVQPYVLRLALVYQNLGNWSATYYRAPGYTLISPVLGMLAYNASNLAATNLSELMFMATSEPISINFATVKVPEGARAKCVRFDLNGSLEYSNLSASQTCSTFKQGHFAVVAELTPSASGLSTNPSSNVWKITVGSVIGGFVVMGGLSVCAIALLRVRKTSRLAAMERRSDQEESLRVSEIGSTRAPTAPRIRTSPVLESEYV